MDTEIDKIECEKITDSEIRFRRFFEFSQIGIILLNGESGLIDYINPFMLNMIGYTGKEMKGKKLWETDSFKEAFSDKLNFKALQSEKNIYNEEIKLKTKDGREIDANFLSNIYPMDHQKVIQCVVQGTAKQKELEEKIRASEQRFVQLIKHSFDTISVVDADGIQRYVSDSAFIHFGYKPSELTNIPVIQEMIHPEDQSLLMEAFLKTVKEGYAEARYRHRHKNGGWIDVEAIGSSQMDNPDIKGVVVNVRVITERVEAEKKLRKAYEEVKKMNDFLINREIKMVELKKEEQQLIEEIDQLKKENEILKTKK